MRNTTAILLLLALSSCSKELFESSRITPEQENCYNAESMTKLSLDDYSVSSEDLANYLRFKEINTIDNKPAKGKAKSIIAINDDNGKTVMYAINYKKGWEIISADKRAPIIVAESNDGQYDTTDTFFGHNYWIKCIGDDISRIEDRAETHFNENESYSIQFWTSICKANFGFDDPPPLDSTHIRPVGGHYELFASRTTTEEYDAAPHLLTTRWGQRDPFNHYCPLKSAENDRVPAGCVAVAGAQMLYYLHNKISAPVSAPDSAYCYGHVGNLLAGVPSNYYMAQWGQSTTIWNDMRDSTTFAPAILIANFGTLIGMDYGDDGSSADDADIPEVMAYYGIVCDFDNYNSTVVYNNLRQGIPSMIGVYRFEWEWPLFGGHELIIDGYKRSRTKTTNTYIWVYDDTSHIQLNIPEYSTVTYGSPFLTYFHMNWGWMGGYDDVWYAPDGSWEANDHDYCIRRTMVTNFRVQ